MTCIRSSALAGHEASVEADRQGAVAQQRVVEGLQRERVAEAPLFVGAQPQQEGPAEQVLRSPAHPFTRELLDAVPGRRVEVAR